MRKDTIADLWDQIINTGEYDTFVTRVISRATDEEILEFLKDDPILRAITSKFTKPQHIFMDKVFKYVSTKYHEECKKFDMRKTEYDQKDRENMVNISNLSFQLDKLNGCMLDGGMLGGFYASVYHPAETQAEDALVEYLSENLDENILLSLNEKFYTDRVGKVIGYLNDNEKKQYLPVLQKLADKFPEHVEIARIALENYGYWGAYNNELLSIQLLSDYKFVHRYMPMHPSTTSDLRELAEVFPVVKQHFNDSILAKSEVEGFRKGQLKLAELSDVTLRDMNYELTCIIGERTKQLVLDMARDRGLNMDGELSDEEVKLVHEGFKRKTEELEMRRKRLFEREAFREDALKAMEDI